MEATPARPGIVPYEGEPAAGPWRAMELTELVAELRAAARPRRRGPIVLAVDGRQGGGKSTLAARIAAITPRAVVVHTDDVAWWESFFGWDRLMATGILVPARRGVPVSFRPPAWEARGRPGAIEVPADASMLIVEGVGSSRESLTPYLDASVWVQSDYAEAMRRGIARDGGTTEHIDFWHTWAAEENPFLAADRPWERADAIVCGTPDLVAADHLTQTQVLRGRSLSRSRSAGR